MTDRQLLTEIGPYRIEGRLGAGGMGEVYRAYDSRLDRSVAVKLVRPEASADGVARERLRREARAAARLSHPSIVQIHDIVESGEGDAIVMELVEGEPLSQKIARGPLPVDESVRLGREIAEGLAAAHARKILHRDLKAENVMVTADGHAKILDFGLAKRIEGEDSLTRTDAVIGTFRCMSPEQARGLELDHRSDLFSFGVLLYELLTGRSPFRAETTLETLNRVCTARQRPVRELRPAVPQGLSDLVDDLLEKDPDLRPAAAQKVRQRLEGVASAVGSSEEDQETVLDSPIGRTVGAAGHVAKSQARATGRWRAAAGALTLSLLLLAAALLLWRGRPQSGPPLYVAVLRPEIAHGQETPGSEILAAAVHTEILRGLLAREGLAPLAPEQVDAVAGPPAQVARATAADEVVAARLDCESAVCHVSLHRVGTNGALLWAGSFAAPIDQPYLVSEAIAGQLGATYRDHHARHEAGELDVRPADYAEYLRLYRSFDLKREEEMPAADLLARLRTLRESSPRFLEAWTFEAYVLAYRFRSRRDPADLRQGLAALEQARALAPADPRPLVSLFDFALLGGKLEMAAAAIRDLEKIQPGDPRVLAKKAILLERQGHREKALALMQEAARHQPSWKHLFWAADMEYRQGRIPEARRHLEDLLSRFPGQYVGTSLLAQLELFYGDPQRAISLYTGLVQRSPQFDEICNLGNAFLVLGRYAEAEGSYRRATALRPANALALLNLADVLLLQHKEREAGDLYRKVLRRTAADPAASSDWQLASARAQALAHLRRSRDAVEAVQRSLSLAPESPQAAWEASLIFTLLGDHASALYHAQRALQQGADPGWFKLAWFDPLRQMPEFSALLPPRRRPG